MHSVLAVLVDDKEDIDAFKDYKATAEPAAAVPETKATPAAPVKQAAAPASRSGDRIFASPLAQNAANAGGINLASVTGTGPNGRIIKADIEDALA